MFDQEYSDVNDNDNLSYDEDGNVDVDGAYYKADDNLFHYLTGERISIQDINTE